MAANNVFFVAAVRMDQEPVVCASFSNNSETDLEGVHRVLEQPNLNISPGKHYSFSVGQMAWHLIADENSFVYIMICQLSYPQRCAHMGLEEIQRNFVQKAGDKASTARERALDRPCAQILKTICDKYDNLEQIDKLASVAKKVDTVKLVMQDNIDIALQNCVKLENIERAAEELQQSAGVFKRTATDLKNKMWWKNMKMKLIIGFIILAIIGIIIGVAVGMSKQASGK